MQSRPSRGPGPTNRARIRRFQARLRAGDLTVTVDLLRELDAAVRGMGVRGDVVSEAIVALHRKSRRKSARRILADHEDLVAYLCSMCVVIQRATARHDRVHARAEMPEPVSEDVRLDDVLEYLERKSDLSDALREAITAELHGEELSQTQLRALERAYRSIERALREEQP